MFCKTSSKSIVKNTLILTPFYLSGFVLITKHNKPKPIALGTAEVKKR